jgi:hypothetical protein
VIFSKTINQVLAGTKSQTMRLCHEGDRLGEHKGAVAVLRADGRPRWVVGHVYSVQPERCHHARGVMRVTSLSRLEDPTSGDLAFARREGFSSVEEYLRVWHELHPRNPVQRVWVIGFELVKRGKRA